MTTCTLSFSHTLCCDTRQLTVGGASVEAIDLQPAQQVRQFFTVIVHGVVITIVFIAIAIVTVFTAAIVGDGEGLEQFQQAVGDTEDRVVLAQFQERPWPAAVLGWRRASAADTDRVVPPWLERQDLLDSHVVLPAVGEVILVQEALTNAQAKVGQAYVSGIVTEADPAIMPDAVLTTLDDETVQVLVGPAQHSLASGVEIGDGTVAANEQAAPDQRADAAQDDAQLVHHRFGVRGRLRHCAIMASAAVSPVAPSPSSDHQRIRDGAWQFAQLACDDIGQPGNAHAWLSPGWGRCFDPSAVGFRTRTCLLHCPGRRSLGVVSLRD